ncbi:MAG: hypothetical protein WCO84_01100 [bacterium]
MEKWYFTFGFNSEFRNNYVVFQGTQEEARDMMFMNFGQKWGFQYNEEDFLPQIEKYGLKELG